MNEAITAPVLLPGLSKYQIRADGEVVSLWSKEPKILRGGDDKDGYRKFVLIGDDGKRRYVRRASLVCTAFHGPRPDGMLVRHRDGSRQNDSKENLSWATQSENCQDKLEHGTAQRGTKNGNCITSEEMARAVKGMLHLPTSKIVKLLPVSKFVVNNIRSGTSWTWL